MWTRIVSVIASVGLMAAPAVCDYGDPTRVSGRNAGPIAASLSVVALSEATRGIRWTVIVPGIWLLLAPVVLGFDSGTAIILSLLSGVIVLVGAAFRGH